jgi:hypothetical protein
MGFSLLISEHKMIWSFIDRRLNAWKRRLAGPEDQQSKSGFKTWTKLIRSVLLLLLLGGLVASISVGKPKPAMMIALLCLATITLGYFSSRVWEACEDVGSGEKLILSHDVYLDFHIFVFSLAFIGAGVRGIGFLFQGDPGEGLIYFLGAFASFKTAQILCRANDLGVQVDSSLDPDHDLARLYAVLLRCSVKAALPVSTLAVFLGFLGPLNDLRGGIFSSGGGRGFASGVDFEWGLALMLGGVALPFVAYLHYVFQMFFIRIAENVLSLRVIAQDHHQASGDE